MASGEFGISVNDTAHIMTILRDTLYSDKVLAVLREYSSNAWDAHRSVGKAEVPIEVTLPTSMAPTLSVRDFGPGLSKEDVFTVYTQYGASTKRSDDNSVGMLGIGCKSAFAYSDSFTITSWHGGMKRTYVAVLDKTEKGVINLLHEEPCGDETGVLIQVAIRPDDITEFCGKAKELFQYFKPQPKTNIELPKLPSSLLTLSSGVLYDIPDDSNGFVPTRKSGWAAVMGCIQYKIDLNQLQDTEGGVPFYIQMASGVVYFGIGELQVNASREGLKYSPQTKKALVDRLNLLVEDYVRHTLHRIENSGYSQWQKKVEAKVFKRLQLPLPDEYKELSATYVEIKGRIPHTIRIFRQRERLDAIAIAKDLRFVLADDRRPLGGFRLGNHEYLVKPNDRKTTWDDVQKIVEAVCEDLGIAGAPIVRLSTLPWAPTKQSMSPNPTNYRIRSLVFDPTKINARPNSKRWEAVERVPQDDDVFVLLDSYNTKHVDLYYDYASDRTMFREFGVVMPTIFGYKTSPTRPVAPTDRPGKHYPDWRKEVVQTLLTPERMALIRAVRWTDVSFYRPLQGDKVVKRLATLLGDQHCITEFARRAQEGLDLLVKTKMLHSEPLRVLRLRGREFLGPNEPLQVRDTLLTKYPLLATQQDPIAKLLEGSFSPWAQYVRAMDLFMSSQSTP